MQTMPDHHALARRKRTRRFGLICLVAGAVLLAIDAVLFMSDTNVGIVPAIITLLWVVLLGAGVAFYVSAATQFREPVE